MKSVLKVMLIFVACLFPNLVVAGELEFGVAPVWWQYEESSNQYAGFAATPLQSSARGYAAELSVGYSSQLQDVWFIDASFKGLLPLNQAREDWRLASGVQSNQLQIIQSELQLDLLRQFNQIKLGGWISYQYHQQSRKNFVINGVQKSIGRITETVQTAWLGAAIESASNDGTVQMRLEGGLPLWVHTTNSSVKGIFNKRAGFRLGADLNLLLPWHLSGQDMSLLAGYQYKELGDEVLASGVALWPKNRWQSISLGMNIQW